jgi:hypothetical protein
MSAALARTTTLFFRKPSAATVRAFLEAQARLNLTYTAVGDLSCRPTEDIAAGKEDEQLRRG